MEQFYTMVGVQASMFVYMGVGYVAKKINIITKELRTGLTNLLLSILLPCMVFNSFNQELSIPQLKSGAIIFFVACVTSSFAWVVGWLLWRNYPPERAKVLRYGTLIANSAFAGLPVIEGAYGVSGLFLASIFIIPNRILMWSAGISLFDTEAKGAWVKKVLLNPAIIAMILGLIRMLLQLPLPAFLDRSIMSMGNCTGSISMIVVGSILADVGWRTIFDRDALSLSVVRLLLLPICALVVLRAIHFDTLATGVAVILTGMPMGSTAAIMAERYGADAGFASKCIFISTMLSLVTISLLTLFLP